MCRRVDLRRRDTTVRNLRCGIEHAEAKACGEEPLNRRINFTLADVTLMNGVDECTVFLATAKIGPCPNGYSGSVCHVGDKLVAVGDIGDCGTVRNNEAFEVPVPLKL